MIERLGPYRIVSELGRGGMGIVYEGIHDDTGQRAAIKALSQEFNDDSSFRQRFLAEIETLKELKHPNIVELYGDGEHDGKLFYAMEFVDGKSLQQELQAGRRFEWTDVTKIAIEICSALKHGHDYGVIHRDLKPANLLRAKHGPIKLADFGIARSFKNSGITAVGCIVGTADYMSPEQADGLPVDNRSDLYSLGTVMFTLLTRRPPFAGGSVGQVFQKLKYEEAPSVRMFAPQVPGELEQIIRQLLSKEPHQRIPTALVLSNRLRAMEFGLAAATVVDPRDAIEEPKSSPADQATCMSSVDEGLVTEVGPTAVDTPPKGNAPGYSWNDATVVTAESDSGANDAVPASADTVIDRPGSRNRFTTIEEDREKRQQDRTGSWTDHLGTAGLGLALLALVLAMYWWLQPPSPKELVRRIRAAESQGEIKEVNGDIKKFLKHYGDHDDAPLVRDWQLDVHCEWLFSRLDEEQEERTLTDGEEFFFEAMRSRKTKPEAARELFQKTIRAADAGQPDPITSAEAARHQLKRLGAQAPELTERAQLPASN